MPQEYGHSTSRTLWDALKATDSAEPAAATPQALPGNSLWRTQQWGSERGYDTFFLGGDANNPILLPVTAPRYWDDRHEVCMDKLSKYSPDGRTWWNFTAWRPSWQAECWYDVALVRRRSDVFTSLVTGHAMLPAAFCNRLAQGWFPHWINEAPPRQVWCAPGPDPIKNGCLRVDPRPLRKPAGRRLAQRATEPELWRRADDGAHASAGNEPSQPQCGTLPEEHLLPGRWVPTPPRYEIPSFREGKVFDRDTAAAGGSSSTQQDAGPSAHDARGGRVPGQALSGAAHHIDRADGALP